MATAKKESTTKTATKADEAPTTEIVIKMTRLNPIFEVVNPETKNKYRFTQAAPYVLVRDEKDVNFLLRMHGMEVATPQQVAEYYDK